MSVFHERLRYFFEFRKSFRFIRIFSKITATNSNNQLNIDEYDKIDTKTRFYVKIPFGGDARGQ